MGAHRDGRTKCTDFHSNLLLHHDSDPGWTQRKGSWSFSEIQQHTHTVVNFETSEEEKIIGFAAVGLFIFSRSGYHRHSSVI